MSRKCFKCGQIPETEKDITLHRLPLPEGKRKQWLQSMGRLNLLDRTDRSELFLCSRHFAPDSFNYNEKRKRIKYGCLPTILDPQNNDFSPPRKIIRRNLATRFIAPRNSFYKPIESTSLNIETNLEGNQLKNIEFDVEEQIPTVYLFEKSLVVNPHEEIINQAGPSDENIDSTLIIKEEELIEEKPGEILLPEQSRVDLSQEFDQNIDFVTTSEIKKEIFDTEEDSLEERLVQFDDHSLGNVHSEIKIESPQKVDDNSSEVRNEKENDSEKTITLSSPSQYEFSSSSSSSSCGDYDRTELMILKKNRNFYDPRHIGDFEKCHLDDKELRDKYFDLSQERLKELKKKTKSLTQQVRRLKRSLQVSRDSTKEWERNYRNVTEKKNFWKTSLPDSTVAIFEKIFDGSNRQHFSNEMKTFALQLYHYSPRAYSYVRSTFNNTLPQTRTVQNWKKVMNDSQHNTEEIEENDDESSNKNSDT